MLSTPQPVLDKQAVSSSESEPIDQEVNEVEPESEDSSHAAPLSANSLSEELSDFSVDFIEDLESASEVINDEEEKIHDDARHNPIEVIEGATSGESAPPSLVTSDIDDTDLFLELDELSVTQVTGATANDISEDMEIEDGTNKDTEVDIPDGDSIKKGSREVDF